MAEQFTEIARVPGSRINRRTALKAGITATIGAAFAGREIHTMHEGIQTPIATFYPLYERHDKGIEEKDLPPQLDGFFREVSGGDFLYTVNPSDLILSEGPTPLFKEAVLRRLAHNEVKIILGDIDIGQDFRNSGLTIDTARASLGAFLIASGYLYDKVKKSINEWSGRNSESKGIPRRNFLKKALFGAGAVTIAPSVTTIMGAGLLKSGMNVEQKNAIQRIYLRLSGIVDHLNPEDHLVFFRNIAMADKLLTTAESLANQTGRKPAIAFNVGAGHAGIEDFLLAGHDFTRWLIAKYPKDILGQIIEINGGMENFCSARVLTLPKDIDMDTFRDFSQRFSAKEQLDERVKDEEVVDEPLLQSLKEKFADEEETRRQRMEADISLIRSVFGKHLSNLMYSKMDDLIKGLPSMSQKAYERIVHVSRSSGEGKEFIRINIYLPDGQLKTIPPRRGDIRVAVQTRNGKPVFESISFFLSDKGEITHDTGRADIVVITENKLKETIPWVFPYAPKNDDEWVYTPQGTGGTPLAGQAYLRSKVGETFPQEQYQISQDGRLEVVKWYEP